MKLLRNLFSRKQPPASLCTAVIVAAGSSTRMGGIDKMLTPMGGDPVVLHTLRAFQQAEEIDEIVLVTREDLMVPMGTLCSQHGIDKVRRVVKGGADRTQSVMAGLREVSPQTEFVAIHDGARPFVTGEVIARTVEAARAHSAAAPAIPVKDTIKRAVDGVVQETPDRRELFAVQTPQVFALPLIQGALAKAEEDGVLLTDDCGAVERLGFPVRLVEGSEENIKVTTPADLLHGEAILAERMGL